MSEMTVVPSSTAEALHLQKVCDSLAQYSAFQTSQLTGEHIRLSSLPPASRRHLPPSLSSSDPDSAAHVDALKTSINLNQTFLDAILTHANQATSAIHTNYAHSPSYTFTSDSDQSKVSSVLKSCVRDWGEEGKAERDACYNPIISAVERHVPKSSGRVLVPGSGLGRLALELASRGYAVQGNDFSLPMLLCSDYILNSCPAGAHEIAPWVSRTVNVKDSGDRNRTVKVPDVDPCALLFGTPSPGPDTPPPDFSMAAGEFLDCYNKPEEGGRWGCIASCFFIDTAPDVVAYVECMYRMLRPGGVVVNLGPLLWHWSGPTLRPDHRGGFTRGGQDERYFTSYDFSWSDVRHILQSVGFEVVEERTGIEAEYTRDKEALMHTRYECVFFVARKPENAVEKEVG